MESLIKLHARTRTIDSYLDDKGDLSTARRAWGELRDDVDRGVYQYAIIAPPIQTLCIRDDDATGVSEQSFGGRHIAFTGFEGTDTLKQCTDNC